MQMLADTFQKRIEQLSKNVAPSLGAALLAEENIRRSRSGDTEYEPVVGQNVKCAFQPRESREEYFRQKYSKYLQIHDYLAFLK